MKGSKNKVAFLLTLLIFISPQLEAQSNNCQGSCTIGEACSSNSDCMSSPVRHSCYFGPNGSVGQCVADCLPHLKSEASFAYDLVSQAGTNISWCKLKSGVINVKRDFGAVCNTEASTNIQNALNAANAANGGVVYLPACTYHLGSHLEIGSNTKLIGAGSYTKLMRNNTLGHASLWKGANNCGQLTRLAGRNTITNKGYNCGNSNITLRDFTIDDLNIPNNFNYEEAPLAVMVALSAASGTNIENIFFKNAPQDAIFLKNPGPNTKVTKCTFENYDRWWRNGSGINVEMWTNANFPNGTGPVTMNDNTFYSTSPIVHTDIGAISLKKPDANAPSPSARLSRNIIHLSNTHAGISCFLCKDTWIVDNKMYSLNSGSRIYSGIKVSQETSDLAGVYVVNNEIYGSGRPNDLVGILVWLNQQPTACSIIAENKVIGKSPAPNQPTLKVAGGIDFHVYANRVECLLANGCANNSGYGISIGDCSTGRSRCGTIDHNTSLTNLAPNRNFRETNSCNNFWIDNSHPKTVTTCSVPNNSPCGC